MVVCVISRISIALLSKFQTTNAQKRFGFQPFLPLISASAGITVHRSFARTGFFALSPIFPAQHRRTQDTKLIRALFELHVPTAELFGTSYPSGKNVCVIDVSFISYSFYRLLFAVLLYALRIVIDVPNSTF